MPSPTRITQTGADGRRRLSPETRQKLSDVGKARFAGLPPDEQERIRQAARDRLARRGAPPAQPGPPVEGGPRSPLDDAPRARGNGAAAPGRPEGRTADHVGAPIFRVPDFDPLPPAPALEGPVPDELGPAPITISQAQVESLLRFPFALVAIRRGDHWRLRDGEADMIAEPLTRKLNESAVAARALALGGDWAIIVGGLAVVVSGRLAEDAKRDDRDDGSTGRAERGTGRVHPPADGGDGGLAPGPGAARPGGSLNGFAAFTTGPLDD